MRTPAGKECRYFYGDYYRGRNDEECRLLDDASPPLPWKADLCTACPVPEILLSNACSHMMLRPRLIRPFPFIKQQVQVDAGCSKNHRSDFDPHIGCGECHPIPPAFLNKDTSPLDIK
jgi:hypothetical protein